jgi:diaminohydroxyphosphoribosylaminopyrimidine deaminase/5-amino-6-(5-phosphoribosylamino)uracil reductase
MRGDGRKGDHEGTKGTRSTRRGEFGFSSDFALVGFFGLSSPPSWPLRAFVVAFPNGGWDQLPMNADEQFLRRAIRLAMNGRGTVEPNPMVGCVIVKDGRVIGEGWHGRYGGPHAEPTALANCRESPAGATAYVTLEPCCHTDKQTPPCAPRLIREKLGRVVVGCLDPNPFVNGRGVRTLRNAGIPVDGPILEAECKQLIAPFLARINLQRPYVTLKWAVSADGKVAGANGARRQISGPEAARLVHQLRGRSDAVAVGIGTVLQDDPLLTVRGVKPDRIPDRLVFDSRLRIPETCKLVTTTVPDRRPTTEVYCGPNAGPAAKRQRLEAAGVSIVDTPTNDAGSLQLAPLVRATHSGLRSHVLVEPGPRLAAGFLTYGAADRVWVIRSPTLMDEPTAPAAAQLPAHFLAAGTLTLDGDALTEFLNTRSAAYFALVPSADLVLAEDPI